MKKILPLCALLLLPLCQANALTHKLCTKAEDCGPSGLTILPDALVRDALLSLSLTASDKHISNPSAHDMLAELFADAQVPLRKQITGWYSGRYFRRSAPNTENAFLLVGAEFTIPGKKLSEPVFRVRFYDSPDPTYYDDMSDKGAELRTIIKEKYGDLPEPDFRRTAVFVKSSADDDPLRYEIRRHGDYTLVKGPDGYGYLYNDVTW